MRQLIKDAIESARSVARDTPWVKHQHQRRHSFQLVRAITYAVLMEIPPEMSVKELCDELNINAAQDVE